MRSVSAYACAYDMFVCKCECSLNVVLLFDVIWDDDIIYECMIYNCQLSYNMELDSIENIENS